MEKSKFPGEIKIIKIPAGEAPLEIRKAWVDLVLPCDPYVGFPDEGLDRGVLSGIETKLNRSGFSVPQDEAIQILEKQNPAAADWWKSKGFPHPEEYFSFAEDEAEIIQGVIRKKVIEWPGKEKIGN